MKGKRSSWNSQWHLISIDKDVLSGLYDLLLGARIQINISGAVDRA